MQPIYKNQNFSSCIITSFSLNPNQTRPEFMAPASFIPSSNTVCVMDASSQLGCRLVEQLLVRGYWVHAAAQSQGVEKLKKMVDSGKWVRVFESDPFDYQSIVDALRGCSAFMYAFEPPFDHPTYDEHMIEVEVRAAHNVLEACVKVDTIDKVIFTSSATAVIWRDDRKTMDSDLDERHWSDVNFCRKFKVQLKYMYVDNHAYNCICIMYVCMYAYLQLWHALSKTLAEKYAWAMASDREINMVTINAGLPITPNVSISHPYLNGASEMYEDGVFVSVDLEFLVKAEICVLEDISTYGRYLCFNNVIIRPEDAFELAKKLAPSSLLEPQSFEDGMLVQQKINNKKMNKLMVDFDGVHSVLF